MGKRKDEYAEPVGDWSNEIGTLQGWSDIILPERRMDWTPTEAAFALGNWNRTFIALEDMYRFGSGDAERLVGAIARDQQEMIRLLLHELEGGIIAPNGVRTTCERWVDMLGHIRSLGIRGPRVSVRHGSRGARCSSSCAPRGGAEPCR
jgi:hypothetical protein